MSTLDTCPNGHPYSSENTRRAVRKGNPYRTCRTCARLAQRRLRGEASPEERARRDALGRMLIIPIETRFWSKVNKNGPVPAHRPDLGPCWLWTASTIDGYGSLKIHRKPIRAHRWSYENAGNTIPAGLELDHLCRNRACVNPTHLEPVTTRVNVLRGDGPSAKCARQTHCKNNHEFTPENTQISPLERRTCRICRREYGRTHRARERLGSLVGVVALIALVVIRL